MLVTKSSPLGVKLLKYSKIDAEFHSSAYNYAICVEKRDNSSPDLPKDIKSSSTLGYLDIPALNRPLSGHIF